MKTINLIDFDALMKCCSASIPQLMEELGGSVSGETCSRHAFQDNGAKVLAVAHLDTVQQGSHLAIAQLPRHTLIFNPKLDDRLGVYTILHMLPKLGIQADVLFTENEEIGKSTAADFTPPKQYNWIVEFDRRGTDAVTYDYDWEHIVAKHFDVGLGAFSDISSMEHLKCMALNVGIGYHDEHSETAHFVLEEYVKQMRKFVQFYEKHKNTRFPHRPLPGGNWSWKQNRFDEDCYSRCPYCGAGFYAEDTICTSTNLFCPDCGQALPLADMDWGMDEFQQTLLDIPKDELLGI